MKIKYQHDFFHWSSGDQDALYKKFIERDIHIEKLTHGHLCTRLDEYNATSTTSFMLIIEENVWSLQIQRIYLLVNLFKSDSSQTDLFWVIKADIQIFSSSGWIVAWRPGKPCSISVNDTTFWSVRVIRQVSKKISSMGSQSLHRKEDLFSFKEVEFESHRLHSHKWDGSLTEVRLLWAFSLWSSWQ